MPIGDEIPEALGAHWCERGDLPETWDILDELAAHAGSTDSTPHMRET
jgi:hypothetical protein